MKGTVTERQLPHTNPIAVDIYLLVKGYGPDLDMDMDIAILFHPAVAGESRRRGRDRLDGMGSKGPTPGSLSVKSTQKVKKPRIQENGGSYAAEFLNRGYGVWVYPFFTPLFKKRFFVLVLFLPILT